MEIKVLPAWVPSVNNYLEVIEPFSLRGVKRKGLVNPKALKIPSDKKHFPPNKSKIIYEEDDPANKEGKWPFLDSKI